MRWLVIAAAIAATPAAAEYSRGDCLTGSEVQGFVDQFGETNVVLLHADPDDPDAAEDFLGLTILTRPDGASWTMFMNFGNERYCIVDYGVDAQFPDVIVRGAGVKS